MALPWGNDIALFTSCLEHLPHFNSLEHASAGFALDSMDFMVENRGEMYFFEN